MKRHDKIMMLTKGEEDNSRLVCDAYTGTKIPCYKADEACTTPKFENIQTLEGRLTAGNVCR
jgi:hypothetical protein